MEKIPIALDPLWGIPPSQSAFGSFSTQLLSNHPATKTIVAQWYAQEWGHLFEEDIYENSLIRLNQQCDNHQDKGTVTIPFTLIGFFENQPVATATILEEMPETRKTYGPWLGYVYVTDHARKKGFGTRIVQSTLEHAQRAGIQQLYLYTDLDTVPFYQSMGWNIFEPLDHINRNMVMTIGYL